MGASLAGAAAVLGTGILLVNLIAASPVEVVRSLWVRSLFWGPGQVLLFADTLLMSTSWAILARSLLPDDEMWERRFRLALFAYVPFLAVLVSALLSGEASHHATVNRWIANAISGAGLGLPTLLIAGLLVSRLVRLGRRAWTSPSYLALVGSLLLYAAGSVIAAAGFRSDLRVPAHYHGTVGAVTLALMGVTLQLLGRGEGRLARWQPVLYGGGLLVMILGLYWAGLLGAPRKTFGFQWADLPALIALNVMGLGAGLAVLGGVAFLLLALPALARRAWRGVPGRAEKPRPRFSWTP
jgi:hypothetical protein